MNQSETTVTHRLDIAAFPGRAVKMLTSPVDFFRTMPKSGGFPDPLVYVVVIALIDVVLIAVKSLVFHEAGLGGIGALIGGLIIGPIVAVIASFIAAAIFFVIWMIMGSKENYETAYRCTAYIYTLSPITILLGFVPYLGLAGIAWGLYLMVTASVEVHKISAKTAWIVFGIVAALFALSYLGMEYAARKARDTLQGYSQELRKMQNGTDKGDLRKQLEEMRKQAEKYKQGR